MEIVHLEEKEIEKKEQMLIDMTKSEKMCVKNSLTKKVKIQNEFEEEQEKNKKKLKKPMLGTLRKGWVNIMKKNHLKFTRKENNMIMVKF